MIAPLSLWSRGACFARFLLRSTRLLVRHRYRNQNGGKRGKATVAQCCRSFEWFTLISSRLPVRQHWVCEFATLPPGGKSFALTISEGTTIGETYSIVFHRSAALQRRLLVRFICYAFTMQLPSMSNANRHRELESRRRQSSQYSQILHAPCVIHCRRLLLCCKIAQGAATTNTNEVFLHRIFFLSGLVAYESRPFPSSHPPVGRRPGA